MSQKEMERQLKFLCQEGLVVVGRNDTCQIDHRGRNSLPDNLAIAIGVVLNHYKVKGGMTSSS